MREVLQIRWTRMLIVLAVWSAIHPVALGAGDEPVADSPLVKLLKSGRIPESRQGALIDMIGKRGTEADLTFLFQHAIAPGGFSAPNRAKVLDALAEAASNRKLSPPRDLDKLVPLIRAAPSPADMALEKPAVRLAGIWKLEAAEDVLQALASSTSVDDVLRAEALDALAAIGSRVGTVADRPPGGAGSANGHADPGRRRPGQARSARPRPFVPRKSWRSRLRRLAT